MRYSQQRVMIRTSHRITHEEFTSDTVEALVACGTGLAIAPINEDRSPGETVVTCASWVLMHVELGIYLGKPFPANDAFAKAFLEEVHRLGLTYPTWEELSTSPARKEALVTSIRNARARVEQRFLTGGSRYVQAALFSLEGRSNASGGR
jgi:hypothetical protein